MALTRIEHNQVFADGAMIYDDAVEVDVTAKFTKLNLAKKARTALQANSTFLDDVSPSQSQVLTQVRRLTRQVNGLIRLQGHVLDELADLLVENTDT